MDFDLKICILLFFIAIFFIYHIYYQYKPHYEGFSLRGGFREGFEQNKKSNKKTKLTLSERSERENKLLPNYEYKEDIPKNEKELTKHNVVVNNSALVDDNKLKESKNYIKNIEKQLETGEFIYNEGNNIWTKFYCGIYDALHLNKNRNLYEIEELTDAIKLSKNEKVLDVGSGTGEHVNIFKKKGYNAIGIDKSTEMINLASKKFPKNKYFNSDVMHGNQFGKNEFGLVTLFFNTVYYINDKRAAFYNINNWLKPGGYMVIHMVDRDKFDPRVKASDPLYKLDVQMYSKERLTKSFVKFNDFQYKGEFIPNKDNSSFVEVMKDDNSEKIIRNEHKYKMEKQLEIVEKAKLAGFVLDGKINLADCNYKNQYLYIFKK